MRLSPLWVFFAVFLLLSHEDVAHAQTAANPIKIKTPVSDPAPFKPDESVVLTSATAVRPPAGFFTSPHTLSLSFSWAISGASGPLTTVTTVVHVIPPYEYSPTAGPTSANPIHPSGAQAAWDYDSVGMVTRKTLPHGIVANMSYDRRRVTSMSYTKPDSSPLAAFVYTYNPDSTIHTMLDNEGTTTYEYDTHQRLAHVDYPTGRLRSEDFEYDRSGNRTRHIRTAQDEFSDRLITYDPADQIDSSVEQNPPPAPPCPEGTPPNQCPGPPPPDRTHFTHDPNGNLTSVTEFKFNTFPSGENTVTTTSYTYNVRNKLTEALLSSGQVEKFAPDSTWPNFGKPFSRKLQTITCTLCFIGFSAWVKCEAQSCGGESQVRR